MKNSDIINLATVQKADPRFTYLSANLRHVRDYDVQKCIRDNEPLLIAEAKAITESITAAFGAKWRWSDPAVVEILERDSPLKLSKIAISEEKIKSFTPNWDVMYCLDFITTVKK
jgi:hypothetical protein